MEPKFQTSFIPKKPIGSATGTGVNVIRTTNAFSVAATVVFIITLLTTGGLFFYSNLLSRQIEQADADILVSQEAYKPEEIKQLVDINDRIISAKKLLENHVVVSNLLDELGVLVVRKMRFNELNYTNKDGKQTISVLGEVQTYNALAEQQEAFLKSDYIKEPEFSNFNLGDNGFIFVNFTARIDPRLTSYKISAESSPLN